MSLGNRTFYIEHKSISELQVIEMGFSLTLEDEVPLKEDIFYSI